MTTKSIALGLLGLLLCSLASAGESFRQPFDLHLDIDGKRYYEEHFERMPYVYGDAVFLFNGDGFGVTLTDKKDGGWAVDYQPDLAKADLTFKFAQIPDGHGGFATMLTIESKISQTVNVEALMTVPAEKAVFKTTVTPIRPGLAHFESWPHPIVKLVLHAFSLRVDTSSTDIAEHNLKALEILLSSAKKAVDEGKFGEANALLQRCLSQIGDSYLSTVAADDSGTKLALADIKEREGDLQMAANIRLRMASDRFEQLREKTGSRVAP